MKSAEQIVECLRGFRADPAADFLGFQTEVLVGYLPFEQAREFLKPEATAADWWSPEEMPQPVSPEKVLFDWHEYMTFAWTKATGHRGISASRSVSKMYAWAWILEDEEALGWCDGSSGLYAPYGAPILGLICTKYGWPEPGHVAASRARRKARRIPGRAERAARVELDVLLAEADRRAFHRAADRAAAAIERARRSEW